MNATECTNCKKLIPDDAPEAICPACLLDSYSAFASTRSFRTRSSTIDQARSSAPLPEELAEWFPRLEIVDFVGAGGMGFVYRAKQVALDRMVALKILRDDRSKRDSFADRFEREAKAMARLDHPNIVGVHESGNAGPYWYLIMEYVEGVTLRELLELGSLTPKDIESIAPQLCEALSYAHKTGIVHRDIKPENILIDAEGRVKIADFGLAKVTERNNTHLALTDPNQVMGTVHYMAPEQMRGTADVDHRADIYSIGVVLYELLTGELPVGRFERPSQRGNADSRFDELVMKSLERDPSRRYQFADELRADIESVLRGTSRIKSGAIPVNSVGYQQRRSYRLTLAIAALAAIFIIVLSFVPLGNLPALSKFEIDQQFVERQQWMVTHGSQNTRLGQAWFFGLETTILPEGSLGNAWVTSLGIRQRGHLEAWPIAIPNLLIPAFATISLLLVRSTIIARAGPSIWLPMLGFLTASQSFVLLCSILVRSVWSVPALALFASCFAFLITSCLPTVIQALTRGFNTSIGKINPPVIRDERD